MAKVYVNLKRFEVPKKYGGLCPDDDPVEWMRWVIRKSFETGLGTMKDLEIVFLVPEALIVTAVDECAKNRGETGQSLSVGCQTVFRENLSHDGNFGAFTSNLPAAAAVSIGARWAMVGHSEERKDKFGVISAFDASVNEDSSRGADAMAAVDTLINQETLRALEAELNVLLCIGETADQRGGGTFEQQKPRIEQTLRGQIERGLKDVKEHLDGRQLVIGYEPIWAIGPGKTPPGGDYIGFVAEHIKKVVRELYGFEVPVVYGGGLKEANAAEIGSVRSVDGGLVALTRFTEPIGFDPTDLERIIETYLEARGKL